MKPKAILKFRILPLITTVALSACGSDQNVNESTLQNLSLGEELVDSRLEFILGSYHGVSGFFNRDSCSVTVKQYKREVYASTFEGVRITVSKGDQEVTVERNLEAMIEDLGSESRSSEFTYSTGGAVFSGTIANASINWDDQGLKNVDISESDISFGFPTARTHIKCKNLVKL